MFWNKKTALIPLPTQEIEFTRAPKRTAAQALADAIKSNFKAPKINGLPEGELVATQDYQAFGGYNGLMGNAAPPQSLMDWYGSQTFIGFQLCMIMAQNWLINAACEIPGLDAMRKGHEISDDSSVDIPPEVLKRFKKLNKKININEKAEEFSKFARVFGYRIAIFNIDGIDYEAPFNPDGIKLGSYQGISMPDPYYVAPQLSGNFNPASPDFFEPEYWLVSGKRYHKSHCIIYRHCIVPQLLKPVYLYGGISLVQQIFEKVYQAESASNEANRLLMTKRLLVRKGDVMSAITDEIAFNDKMDFFRDTRDNYGEQLIDTTEDLAQLETGLAEVAEVITQRYEQVAAIARMPANKLMQTQLQGFASSGEAEEAVYNGMLETLQEKCLTPFLERHYLCAARSLGISTNEYEIIWPPIDTITEKEQAEINQIKATTDQINVTGNGALSGEDIRNRLVKDKNSGYHGIKETLPEIDYSDDNEEADIATQDSDHWVSTETGSHLLIGGEGYVIAGAGGALSTKKQQKTKLSSNEKSAISSYSGDEFLSINKNLREEKIEERHKNTVDRLDSAVSKGVINSGEKLYRGMSLESAKKMFEGGEVKKGQIISDKAFLSTSKNLSIAKNNYGFGGVVMEIEAKGDKKGLDISDMSRNEHEKEVLLPRNAKLQVHSMIPSKSPGQPHIIKMHYINDD